MRILSRFLAGVSRWKHALSGLAALGLAFSAADAAAQAPPRPPRPPPPPPTPPAGAPPPPANPRPSAGHGWWCQPRSVSRVSRVPAMKA
jgi:hypothetical protein